MNALEITVAVSWIVFFAVWLAALIALNRRSPMRHDR